MSIQSIKNNILIFENSIMAKRSRRRSKRSSKRKEARKFLEELKEKQIQTIEDKKRDMKQVGQWKGTVDIYGKTTKVHIEILEPKKSNYYIYIPCEKKSVFGRCVFGPLTKVEKGRQDTEWKKGKGEVPMKHPWYKACVNYSARGSHQGGPMHSYQEHFCMFSKNEKVIDSLITFLSKYSKKVHDKTKKKKGGGLSLRGVESTRVSQGQKNKRCRVGG